MVRANVDVTVRRLVANLLRIVLLIALALQNTLENLISGVLILLRKPYDRGEVIGTNDIEGFVEDIDLRVTTIRTFDGTLVLVPNADIFRAPLTNFTRRGTRRSEVQIRIDYRDGHVAAKDILLQAALLVGAQARDGMLTACKTALEDAGMTIPWPIRTLAADMQPLQVERPDVATPSTDDDTPESPGA